MSPQQLSENPCLICIIGKGGAHPKHIYYFSEDNIRKSFQELEVEAGARLLYYRWFDNTFDALAHKLMLQSLSTATVDYNIKVANKDYADLLPQLKKELEQRAGVVPDRPNQ